MAHNRAASKLMVLSPSQKSAVQETWAHIYAEAESNGIDIMLRLFEQTPHVQSYFEKYVDKILPDVLVLEEKDVIQRHAIKMMEGLNSLIINLDNPCDLRDNIRTLSSNHVEHGVTSSDFQMMFEILQQVLLDRLGDKYDDNVATSWNQFCKIIWTILDTEMDSSSSV